MESVKEAQHGHPSIEGIKRKVSLGRASEFNIDEQGILWYGERLCVPNVKDLKQQILTESHTAPYSIHPGGTKMYKDLQENFWWHGMKRDIARSLHAVTLVNVSRPSTRNQPDCYSQIRYPSGNGTRLEWTLSLDCHGHDTETMPYGS